MGFIRLCNDAVAGVRSSSLPPKTTDAGMDTVSRIVEMLRQMGSWVDDIPPIDEPMRFGNKAFRYSLPFLHTHRARASPGVSLCEPLVLGEVDP